MAAPFTRGGHTQQPTNTMSTESTQYPQDWEPVFTDNHTEHAATTYKFAVLGTIFCQQACFLCFSYYIGNCWVCTSIDTVWVGLKFTRKLCFRINFVLPMLYLYILNIETNISEKLKRQLYF
jgi:hypothetical protein